MNRVWIVLEGVMEEGSNIVAVFSNLEGAIKKRDEIVFAHPNTHLRGEKYPNWYWLTKGEWEYVDIEEWEVVDE